MTANIIDGKEKAKELRKSIKQEIIDLTVSGIKPGLAVVLVGEDPASKVYVGNKEKACQEVGMYSEVYRLSQNTTREELIGLIDKLNNKSAIHGILVQLPLPEHLDEKEVINRIAYQKDVDGFHPISAGKLFIGEKGFVPCTPKGCLYLIKETGVEIKGKKVVVIGRSNIVGKPVSMLLLQENATVTICHSRTSDLKKETSQADILIVAVGKANFITGDMIKTGAVVIDVGMNRLDNGKLAGDVNFSEALERAGWLTPVPGGVGPMTIAMLMQNTLEAAKTLEFDK